MISKVWRNQAGLVRNIGDWDEMPEYDETGTLIAVHNPLPQSYTVADEEVVEGFDGGLYAANDPRRLGKED